MKIDCEVEVDAESADTEVVAICCIFNDRLEIRVISRRKWTPPSWLNPGWIWMDGINRWWWCAEHPSVESGQWRHKSSHLMAAGGPSSPYNLSPPYTVAHETSLRKIHGTATPINDQTKIAPDKPALKSLEVTELAEKMLSRANLRYKIEQSSFKGCYHIVDQESPAISVATWAKSDAEVIAHDFNVGGNRAENIQWVAMKKIPVDIAWDQHCGNFRHCVSGLTMGLQFWQQWSDRKDEFPVWAEGAEKK